LKVNVVGLANEALDARSCDLAKLARCGDERVIGEPPCPSLGTGKVGSRFAKADT